MLSVFLCAALFVQAASVVPAEVAAAQQENNAAPEPEVDTDTAVAGEPAPPRQARFQFCLTGWESFGGSCYYLGNIYESWTNAEQYCAGYGGNLASVHDIWQYNFLQRLVRNGGHAFAWIGGYHFEDLWRWADGSRFDYHNWELTSPTDIYKCLQLNTQESKGWSNHGCSTPFPFVCQVKRSNC